MNLFSDKQKFVHSLFSTTLQTYRSKKFVRCHEEYFDTQMVYKKLYGFYATSVGSRFSASDMLNYIALEKLDYWKGPTESFIRNWQDQVRLYESLDDAYSYFSENQNKTLLENAVASVKPFRSIKDQADQLFTHT